MSGIALVCTLDGTIEQIIGGGLGVPQTARSLSGLAAPGSGDKAGRFVAEVRERGAAFDWEIELLLDGQGKTLRFAGARQDDSLLLIGAPVLDDVFALYEELARVNNEQTTLLRRAIKERVLVTRQAEGLAPLDELALINNEMVNLQREVSKKNQLLERLDRQKNAFLGMAAHDLRNPISSIRGYTELLLEVDLDRDQQRQTLEAIGRVAEHMLALVNDLLDVSVIESGKLELRRVPVNLAQLVQERVAFFRLLADKKGIAIDEEIADGVTLRLDPGRMEQVIDNLISNAVKYSPRDTRARVRLRREEGGALLEVADRGPGLSAEEQERLFGAFERLSTRPTGGEKSTGLGLAITRRIVEAHGGAITVESAPGEGSRFTVNLIDRQELTRVLLVDDDEDIRSIAEMALEAAELEVQTCASAGEALETIPGFAPDLVLLDVEMPGTDGPATLAAMRADPRLKEIPVVFLTARAGEEHTKHYLSLGAIGVIAKPFDPLELPKRIEAIWG